MLSQLRHQLWMAAALLFTPWLLTIVLSLPFFKDQPAATLALLPGLAVAARIQSHLSRHLPTNHRRGEEGLLFPTLGAANWITLLRASAVVTLAGFLPITLLRGHGLPNAPTWIPGMIYLGLSAADLLDGYVARKQRRETELGKHLDIETDAAGLLVASLLAVSLGRLPASYLLVGLAYYPFIAGIRLRQKRHLPLTALQSRPYARILAGFQMCLVSVALLPLLNPTFLFIAAIIFMTPLLAGFLRDWLVVSCRISTDSNQQTAIDRWAGRLWRNFLPLMLRPLILICGAMAITGLNVYQTHPFWPIAQGVCCLLAGCGCLGRCACLILALLLGSNLSPFGMTTPSMVLFATAVTLMLTGSGTMSLWSPEERILYRGHRNP